MRRRLRILGACLAMVFALAACPLETLPPESGTGHVRLLTASQHANAIRDLLGDVPLPEVRTTGVPDAVFIQQAELYRVGGALAYQYRVASEAAARHATANIDEVLACDRTVAGDTACAAAFIDDFVPRAFRRALEPEEREAVMDLYRSGRAYGFAQGIGWVVEAVLQSPDFLYRTAIGDAAQPRAVVELSSYELAAELSFLLLDSIPDPPLWRAARDGSLSQPEVLSAHVDRLLSTPRVQAHLDELIIIWLGAERVSRLPPNPQLYRAYDLDLGKSMAAETSLFVHDVLWRRGGSLSELLTSSETFVDARLAAHYGHEGVTESEPVRVSLDPAQRSGILTHASVLSGIGMLGLTSIVRRGLFVNQRFLCTQLGVQPSTAVAASNSETESLSDRESVGYRAAEPTCSPCHDVIDPAGVAFESYDGIGGWRETVKDVPVDPTTDISLFEQPPQRITGLPALARLLADAPQVSACVVDQFMEHAFGRKLHGTEQASRDYVLERFVASGGDLVEIFRAIPQAPAFRRRGATP